ncbi:signal recognition particle-docking protein FtsY [Thermanaerosceptrum fracticalcis]|nr:signal recognition particle-docking protein FtsY [Thermanaerosceptrum fracticalcis]
MGFFSKLKESLVKTKEAFVEKVTQVVTGRKPIDEELFDELEEALIQADVGVTTSLKLVETLRKKAKENKLEEAHELRGLLEEEITRMLEEGEHTLNIQKGRINVILIVGVNGVGKTTSIGKLSHKLKQDGYKVLVAAGDTFRAAAIDQLEVWCQRAGVDIIHQKEGSDPAAVVYDGIQAARSRKADVLVIDTAGRLQNKTNLMEELRKIRRVVEREIPDGPHEVLLVLDATTGQNALSQARIFGEVVQVSGVILTKLDGTAKGGVILGIQNEYKFPVKFIGVGEKMEDLRDFEPQAFAQALFGKSEEEE